MLVVLHRLPQGSAGSTLSLSRMMHQGCYGLDGVLYRYVGEVLEVFPKIQELSDELQSLAEVDQICFYFSQLKIGKIHSGRVTFLFCRFWRTCTVILGC